MRSSLLALSVLSFALVAPLAHAAPAPTLARRASLVFFYFEGDPPLFQAAQQSLPIHLAMQGYERVVLLADDPKHTASADEVQAPTRANWAAQLRSLSAQGYVVDLWFLAHGGEGRILAQGADIRDSWLEREFESSQLSIRVVYQMNCHGATLNERWLALGAKAAMGSRTVNFHPTQFAAFARAWNQGDTFAQAVRSADTQQGRTPALAYVAGDAVLTRDQWGGCAPFSTIFNNATCGQAYFEERWHVGWRRSAQQTMRWASHKVVQGNGAVRKSG